ncbi:hypothetical protein OF83DRAFT_127499 [Amylostereum chailletii]|nr:hypothetical protein OF83DRAFT_127499 [Amylostereum chailletii]
MKDDMLASGVSCTRRERRAKRGAARESLGSRLFHSLPTLPDACPRRVRVLYKVTSCLDHDLSMNHLDPLGETTAPRYALESDDEEDELNPLSQSNNKPAVPLDIQIKCMKESPGLPLIIAAGDAGKTWARGAKLGEQSGSVFVNNITVGMLFNPSYAAVNVVVSEATTSLPIWAMHPYAQAIVDFFKPTHVTLLDSYAVPLYISPQPLHFQDAPTRYLSTHGSLSSSSAFQPFEPPNLVQTTSASFVSIMRLASVSSGAGKASASLILLPSAHAPRPRPTELQRSLSSANDVDTEWSADVLREAHRALLEAGGDGTEHSWEASSGSVTRTKEARVRGDIGEGGMYI